MPGCAWVLQLREITVLTGICGPLELNLWTSPRQLPHSQAIGRCLQAAARLSATVFSISLSFTFLSVQIDCKEGIKLLVSH